jgi:hypothetical protein
MGNVDAIHLSQVKVQWWAVVKTAKNLFSGGLLLKQQRIY